MLASIADNYSQGTPNGIRMDADSALIWSPSHFTWMDTNYPAGTPREGYPVEIQVLWIRLLRLLERISAPGRTEKWRDLADHATASFEKLFWLEDKGWFADVLLAKPRVIAPRRRAPMTRCAAIACLRSASAWSPANAPSAASRPRENIWSCPARCARSRRCRFPCRCRFTATTSLLNNPVEPYWPRYEGDEDTRRKPAYHNGTAWTWTFPTFCEALARAWEFSPEAVAAAKSYLGSAENC